jgi:hypothetical protein
VVTPFVTSMFPDASPFDSARRTVATAALANCMPTRIERNQAHFSAMGVVTQDLARSCTL